MHQQACGEDANLRMQARMSCRELACVVLGMQMAVAVNGLDVRCVGCNGEDVVTQGSLFFWPAPI